MYIVIRAVDVDADKRQLERCCALEASGGLGVFNETGSAGSLRNRNPAVDFDGFTYGGRKVLTWSADFRADGFVEHYGDHCFRRNDDRPWARRSFPYSRLAGTCARVRSGRVCIRCRGLLLVRAFFLTSRQRKQQAERRQRSNGETTIHELPPVGVGSINDTTNASDVNLAVGRARSKRQLCAGGLLDICNEKFACSTKAARGLADK